MPDQDSTVSRDPVSRDPDSRDDVRIGGGGKQLFVKPAKHSRASNTDRLISGRAWDDFCDAIKRSGQHMLAMDIDWAELDYVDAFQYLAGIVQGGIRTAIDHADPAVPMWVHNGNAIKHSGDNADNRYLIARLDPTKEYRLYGQRRNCFDMMIEVSEGYMQQGEARTFATMSFNDDFSVEEDGTFEIVLSAEPHEGNWMPLHPEGRQLIVRMYFADWETEEPASIAIEQIGHEGLPPARVDPARMAEILDDASAWIESNALFWPRWIEDFQRKAKSGTIEQAGSYLGGAKDIFYGHYGFWLDADEALVIEGTPPEAKYWSFQLENIGVASLDYGNNQTSLNLHQIHVDNDGKYRLVIAHEDPGVANWIDTCGPRFGLLIWRWVWSRNNPTIAVNRTRLADLASTLPADTARLSPAERREAIAIRQRHVSLRERSC